MTFLVLAWPRAAGRAAAVTSFGDYRRNQHGLAESFMPGCDAGHLVRRPGRAAADQMAAGSIAA
ncbi:hypothetical protein, partial [Nocardia gipuzkoensis]|uniref:hypothetical protein n=1 Tax=Nocardia gipuzkoensis TaxID=2749991 RepID=UPI00237D85D0